MNDHPFSITLRELDQQSSQPKGSAFRVFKALETQLAEGVDYLLLDHDLNRSAIAELKRNRKIYPTSINVLVFTDGAAQRLLAALATTPNGDATATQQ